MPAVLLLHFGLTRMVGVGVKFVSPTTKSVGFLTGSKGTSFSVTSNEGA